jgi:diacylglycerol kinase (ATP)
MILNPAAGRSSNKTAIFDVVKTFDAAGYEVVLKVTEKSGDATAFTKGFAGNFDIVVCCGGDGTLNETINGLMALPNAPILGYIPVGTANDVATTLNLSKNPVKAAEDILHGKEMNLDVGVFGDKFFAYIAAFGAFTDVSYQTPQQTKNLFGHTAYMLEAMKRIPDIMPIHTIVELEDQRLEDEFVFGAVSNSTSLAGVLKLNPEMVRMDDGLFEVMLIRNPNNILKLQRVLNGLLTQKYDEKYLKFFHTAKIKFLFPDEISWTIDGEAGGMHKEVTLENRPSAVRFIVPDLL